MKRVLSIVLALLLCLSQLPVISFADAAETPVTALSDFTFTLDTEHRTVTLTKYTGANSAVTVAGSYTVDGVTYATLLDAASVFIYNSVITSVTVQSGVGLANNTAAYLFGKCTGLTSVDLSGLNTTGVTSMMCMFAYCSALTSLDLTGLDTACVTDMTGLFSNCEKLTTLTGYESWNTGAVESIYMAFNQTASLEKVDLSRWDLSNVTNSGWCFQLCNASQILLPDSLEIYYVGLGDPNYIISGDDGNLNAGSNLNIAIYCYTGITGYAVKDTNPNYTSIDGIIYSKDMTTVVAVPSRYDRLMNIPEGVTAWDHEAMWAVDSATVTGLMSNCPGVSIPSTLVDISQDQIDKLNRLKTANTAFSIAVSEDNPAYCLDESGCLTVRTVTEETEPTVTEPTVTEPVVTEPVETVPSETEPTKTQPTENTSPETEPAETEPVQTEPVVTEPPATAPVEVKPMETMPSETEPSETRPTETTSPVTGPTASEPEQTDPAETEDDGGQDRSGGISPWLSAVRVGCLAASIGAVMVARRKKETKL